MTARRLRALTSAGIYVGLNFLQKGIAFLLVPLYTRYLDAEQYGLVAIVLSVSTIASVAYSLSIDSAATRFYFKKDAGADHFRTSLGTLNGLVLVLMIVATVLIAIVGPPISRWLLPDVPFLPYIALGIVIAAAAPSYQIYERLLRAKQQGGVYAVLTIGKLALQVGGTVLLVVVLRWGAVGVLTGVAVASAVFAVIAMRSMVRDYGVQFDRDASRRIFAYTMPLLPNKFAAFAVTPIQNLLVSLFQSVAQVGLFHIGSLMGNTLTMFGQSVNEAYTPWVFARLENGDASGRRAIVRVSVAFVTLMSLLALIGSLVAKEVFQLFVYGELRQAWVIFPYFAFFGVANTVKNIWLTPLMYVEGGTKYAPVATYLNLALNVALGVALIPVAGITGAAVSLLAGRAISSVVMMYYSRRTFDIGLTAAGMYLVPTLCLAVSMLAMTPLLDAPMVRFTIAGGAALFGLNLIRQNMGLWKRAG